MRANLLSTTDVWRNPRLALSVRAVHMQQTRDSLLVLFAQLENTIPTKAAPQNQLAFYALLEVFVLVLDCQPPPCAPVDHIAHSTR